MSNSILPTNSSETTNGEEDVEPFHGFDPEKVISEPFNGLGPPEGRIDPTVMIPIVALTAVVLHGNTSATKL